MKVKVLILVIILVVVVIAGILFIKNRPDQQRNSTDETVRIGYLPISLDLPFFVALGKDYFSNAGLNVEPVKFVTSNPAVEALYAGRVDAITACAFPAILAAEQTDSGKMRVFMTQDNVKERYIDYILIPKESNITSLADLKGKKLGIFPGSTARTYARIILRSYFDPDKDLTMIQLPPETQLEALASGKVDALMTWEPLGTMALQKDVAKILIKAPGNLIMDPLPGGGYALSTAFIKKNPSIANKVVEAMNKAVDYIRENERESKLFIPNYTPIDSSLAQKINVIPYRKLSEINIENIQTYADLLFKEGELKSQVNAEKMILQEKELGR